jgi:(1->4)-alpha-D-glucan 1-alpha-D-glucosylmutase
VQKRGSGDGFNPAAAPPGQLMKNERLESWSAVPDATYRMQFNSQFTFEQGAELVDYLWELGISDCYASPVLAARAGSMHGYDIIDHSRLNPELGGRAKFTAFAQALKKRGMGLILDVVPNHMCIAGGGNRWWEDILEEGPGSPYAGYLDIDWRPPSVHLHDKVLLPTLGDQYGTMLENQGLRLEYRRGMFTVRCYEMSLPLASETGIPILRLMRRELEGRMDESNPQILELESILTSLDHLPPRTHHDPEKLKERRRERVVIRRRLGELIRKSRIINQALQETLRRYNGVPGEPESFDLMEELLALQSYRLCYWRVAADEINYRRFFDVNELAAIRVEEPEVFTEVHELIFDLIGERLVTGLRIDHIDGLYDPAGYLQDLRQGAANAMEQAPRRPEEDKIPSQVYVVVEKILERNERLRPDWSADGTTGYDFLNLLNGVFVDAKNGKLFRRLYERFTGVNVKFDDVAYECKQLILEVAMSSELQMLSRRLDRISEQSRHSRDYTLNSLQKALGEVIACFPVYRTYLRPGQFEVAEDDRRVINQAIRSAKRRNPALSPSIFDFIGGILTLDHPAGLSEKQIEERNQFAFKFQQLTGPVIAKGLEDTAFYRWFPLASLNEVGGDPSRFGVSMDAFHQANADRARDWPHTMLATSTHDVKRGEDVRARLNVLSEIPGRWYRAIRRWQQLNRNHQAAQPESSQFDLHPNEEYLIYQTLLGTWPFDAEAGEINEGYIGRIEEYMVKAVREAKIHSSWLSPNEEYEAELKRWIRLMLAKDSGFLPDFVEFTKPVAFAGVYNSLAQTLLKITAPGAPDFYQGSELWDLNLVDPDNRGAVDYAHRRAILRELKAGMGGSAGPAMLEDLKRNYADGRLKLFLISTALEFRRRRRELFLHGDYAEIETDGALKDHFLAAVRRYKERKLIVVVGRFLTRLMIDGEAPVGHVWEGNSLLLGSQAGECYRDVLTGRRHCVSHRRDSGQLPMEEVFAHLPVALLEQVYESKSGTISR